LRCPIPADTIDPDSLHERRLTVMRAFVLLLLLVPGSLLAAED